MYYYCARYYDPRLSIFISVDPLAEKYPNIGSYVYVANNPINFIDPDGREIWIVGSNGVKIQYTSGMIYKGDDSIIKSYVNTLNNINSTANGFKALDTVLNSSNVYTFNKASEANTGYLLGKDVYISDNFIDVDAVSHELFHLYQYDRGQGGASIFNEIEAYLFSESVKDQFYSNEGYGSNGFVFSIDNTTKEGALYEKSIENLLYNSFSEKDFNNSINLFRSNSNARDNYLNEEQYPLRRENQKDILIKEFYPLTEQ